VARDGERPPDGPDAWTGGTLFPQSSKKVARALDTASGVRPAIVLAALSGFDGSPESMRRLQLEHGAEIARAVVGFAGPLLFVVVSRYHGGAYVVFSKALNDGLHALALEGAHASVIGGSAAATVVLDREVRARAALDPAVRAARAAHDGQPVAATRAALRHAEEAALLDARAALASEFDAIHSVARARDVGSLDEIVPAARLRPRLIELLDRC
jgi:acetyl-CoA carboxylase carboxyltransferase component